MRKTNAPWMFIAEAFCHSITPACLVLALIGILATSVGWQIAGVLLPAAETTEHTREAREFHQVVAAWPGGFDNQGMVARFVRLCPSVEISQPLLSSAPIDPIFGVQRRLMEPFRRLFTTHKSWSLLGYYLFGGLITLLVWAFCGTAITRTAVVRSGLQEPIGFREALRFGWQRSLAVCSAVTLPLVGIAMLAMPFVVLGWTMKLDVGIFVASVVWPGVLLAGLLMTILSLGMIAGWPLMWGAIAAEDSDAFDAISRSYAYTFQRPLHYLFYICIAAFIASLGWLLAWWFSESVIHLSFWSVELGCGAERLEALRSHVNGDQPGQDMNTIVAAGAFLMRISVGLVRCAASAYSFSIFWCSAGAIYLLLRRDTDQTELDDILFEPLAKAEPHATWEPDARTDSID